MSTWDPANYYFSGQGTVLVGDRTAAGKSAGLVPVGNVSALQIAIATSVLEHKESYSGSRGIDLRLTQETKATLSVTMENFNAYNLALALLLERATGQRYRDFLERRLWQPLGAGDAEMMLDSEGGRVFPFCCLWSLPRDWARLGQMLLDEVTTLCPELYLKAMAEANEKKKEDEADA
jgi:hypothetical protein